MTDYDHADALRFRAEADRLQKRVAELEKELAGWKQSQGMMKAALDLRSAQWASVPWEVLLNHTRRLIGEFIHQGMASSELNAAYDWLVAHAPKGPQP